MADTKEQRTVNIRLVIRKLKCYYESFSRLKIINSVKLSAKFRLIDNPITISQY